MQLCRGSVWTYVQEVTDSIWALLSSATWMRQYEACTAGGQAYYTALLYRRSAVSSAQPFSLHHYPNTVMGDALITPMHTSPRLHMAVLLCRLHRPVFPRTNHSLLNCSELWGPYEHMAGAKGGIRGIYLTLTKGRGPRRGFLRSISVVQAGAFKRWCYRLGRRPAGLRPATWKALVAGIKR